MKIEDIYKYREEAIREYLKILIMKLDDLDMEDFFGTEGWRHFLMGED